MLGTRRGRGRGKLTLLLTTLLFSTILPLAINQPRAEAQVCPAGTTAQTVRWGAGGVVWNDAIQNTGSTQTYPIGGGVDMTMSISDPSNMNEDNDNPLLNLPTSDGNWDTPTLTRTDGAFGAGFLTWVVTAENSDQDVTFSLDFSAPVLLPDFSIGDVDYVGNNLDFGASPSADLHDSFQDEILLSANRNGIPVGFTGTPMGGSRPVITLNDAANGQFKVVGGPYANSTNGNLVPTDLNGTVRLSTLAPVTGMSMAYSNGPDDTTGDQTRLGQPPHNGAWIASKWTAPLTATSVGVSNNHAVRVNIFTVCVGTMSIGDSVWEDTNGDGVQGPAEPGLEGVTVTLYGEDGIELATTTTGPNGEYAFENLPPWTYEVEISNTPPDYVNSFDPDTGTVTPDNSSGPIVLSGTSVNDVDFGLQPPLGSIAGTVFADPANNGTFEPGAGDTPIQGVTVTLTGTDSGGNPVSLTTTTEADGTYLFENLPPGTYTVTETQPTGFDDGIDTPGTFATSPANDQHTVVLPAGEASVGNDFAEIPASTIAGTVFEDDDNDGEPDLGEAGIGGATVTLTGTDSAGNAVSRTTTTAPDGTYSFDGLRDGTYTVTETQPDGYLDGLDDAGSAGGDDSVNDVISAIDLPIDTDATGYDFGEVPASSIAGSVYDQDDNPIPGTTITLSGTDDLGNPVSATTTTDANGDYLFPDLRPGTYTVTETQPVGYGDGPDSIGDQGGDDSVNDEFSAIELGSGVDAVDYDFTETTSSIAGTVVDDQGNPIPNVTITLSGTDAAGNPVTATTTTDANGDYLFPGLAAGTYVVTETQPVGYGDGGETAGSTGGDDSVNDVISNIVLPLATDSVDNDFDETTASIAGSVFEDADNDGQFDLGEAPIEGVTVTLSGTDDLGNPVTATATTDVNGDYLFDGLLSGTYAVTETQPTSHIDGLDDAGSEGGDTSVNDVISAIDLGAGVAGVEYDFGEIQPSSIVGTVFEDDDNDGVQDLGEAPIEGVTVTLSGTDDLGNPVTATATTDVNGDYLFGGLRPGTYTVTETQPTAYLDGLDTPGTEGGDDSVNDVISAIDLPPFTSATGYDFGELPPSSIAGSVVDDLGEPIPNVTITLSGTDDLGNPVTATTTTDVNGDYLFEDLRPGTYTVTETQPVGYGDGGETAGSTGGDDTVDDVVSAIVLGAGVDSINNDFDETTASISGTVFEDPDNDGVQDDGEPGIEGVTVTLTGTDDLGNPVNLTTTTDANGDYEFPNLISGTYTVTETQPDDYVDGIDTAGSAGGDDSVNDVISAIDLTPGANATDYDFAEVPPSSIAGSVVDDLGDPIPNVTLTLSGTDDLGNPVTATTTTDANGDYVFADLRPGTYTLTETQPVGYGDGGETAGSTGGDDTVDDVISAIVLGPDQNSVNNDFDETTASIAGSVFEDADNDGQFDLGEAPIEGVTVTLTGTDDLGNPVDLTTTTDVNGEYEFANLISGTYTVTETQPASHIDGVDDAGSEGGDTSVNDVISAIDLGAGVAGVEYDFGEIQPSSIAGSVFEDDDNDGVQDLGEAPIEGVTVTLSGTDDLGNPVSATATTDVNGEYLFDGLRPGTYTVTETQPDGYLDGIDTAGTSGGDDAVNDVISAIDLAPFTDATGYDFGELPPSSIAGSVVDDLGDPIPGTTITLSGTDDLGNPVTATTTTDANGDYVFEDLRPGTYTVTETQPVGYGDGGETAGSTGGDDTVDDVISAIVLGAGVDSVDNDFDETTASISGTVFEDPDNDGQPDLGEPGIEGVTVTLTGTDDLGNPVSLTTTTDANGDYEFPNLISGTYTVTETQPASHIDGTDDAGSEGGDDSVNDVISAIELPGGVNATGYDFGEIQLSSIAGSVFEDDDNDGVQDVGEAPIEGVTVTLSGTDDLGNPVSATATTDVNGEYLFDGLRPGTYTVTETQPDGYLDGIDTAGTSGGDDAVNDVISAIDLAPFTDATGYDFGELPPSSIAGSVVDDLGDPIPGTTITLSGTDDLGNPVTATTTTDANGDYVFEDLRPGTYTVTETQPVGYGDGGETAGSTGGDDTVDDVISAIVLGAGVDSINNDFDETTASIAGSVFEDADNDGQPDLGEAPIEGVTVTLTGTDDLGNPVNLTTTTDANGEYEFPNLISGTYTVTETQPVTHVDGVDDAGSEGGDTSVNDVISTIDLAGGVNGTGYDFGEIQLSSIAGSVFEDDDNDGVQDVGEAPIEGATVTLSGTDDLGNPVSATATTDVNGEYLFDGLRPGTYTVTETQPDGYLDGIDTAGTSGGDDAVNDVISAIDLPPFTDATGYDFGELPPSSIAGSVVDDLGDPIPGTTITLSGTDDLGNPVTATTTTDVNGDYLFEDLRPGTYTVTETQPVGYGDGGETAGSTGGDDTVDDVISAIVLGAGVDSIDNDFDETTASISGTVFEDPDNDGQPDLGEPGIEGVTVTLTGTDDLGNPVNLTTTTDANGDYEFPNLISGTYTVTETQPGEYLDGIDTAGTSGGDDAVNDVISAIDLTPGTEAIGYDFGELPPSSIAGSVVDDLGDPIPGTTITLNGTDDLGNPVTATTTTDANGDYVFADLRPGTYTVTETQPVGYGDGGETAGSTGGDDTVDDVISAVVLGAGVDSVDNDFDETTASISGTVFEDPDNDGVQEAGETGIEGVTVTLTGTDDLGNPVSLTTTTDANGAYEFDGLLSGTYTVTETQPVDYFDGIDTVGSAAGDGSVNDVVSAIELAPGTEATDYDFAEVPPASISGTVEEDRTGDGVPEGPLAGVTVELLDEDGVVVRTTTTDENGDYVFEDVPPGTYTIVETDPQDYDSVSDVGGPNDNRIPVTMAGVDIVDQDFVDEPLASISGTVEEDRTGDGVPKGPLVGVTVELLDEDGVVVRTTTTDENGDYVFEDVPPGTYTIVETDPQDYDSVSDVGGPNDNRIPVTMAGVDIVDQDFVDEPLASISGTVEEDRTGDGVPEGPLVGVTVELLDEDGVVVRTTTTDENGDYVFEDVPPGTYTIVETDPQYYDSVSDVGGPNDNRIPVTMAGVDIVDQDFVDEPLASISGTVEEDDDQDGLPDKPLPGVIVELVDEDGVVVLTTTTDENGDYVFEDVPPGSYAIIEQDPAAYRPVSDIGGPNDNRIPVTMQGVDIVDQDFVDELIPSSLSGHVRRDTDGDGTPNEPIPAVVVELLDEDGTVIATTTTQPDGSYVFLDVPPGTYTLVETDPAKHQSVSDIAGPNDNRIPVTVPPGGEPVVDQDFLDEPLVSISGIVEQDDDHDGTASCEEAPEALSTCGLEDVVIELLDDSGAVIATTKTGPDGSYRFENVPPGDYVIREVDPEDFASISDVAGSNDNRIPVKVAGVDVVDRDFLDGPVYAIEGKVLIDSNGDGLGDTPQGGVVVILSDPDGEELARAITAADGSYSFPDLPPGDYVITETDPSGYRSNSDVDGPNDNVIRVSITDKSVPNRNFVDVPVPVASGGTPQQPLSTGGGTPSTASSPTPTRSEPTGPLALTGRTIATTVAAGAALVALGTVLVWTARRRTEVDEMR